MAIEKGVYKKPHGSGDGSSGTIIMNINNNGGQGQDLNVKSITANVGDITKLKVHTANIDDANIMYLMSSEGQISKISGNDLHYDSGWIGSFISDEVNTKKLTVDETATINQLIANYINSNQITTDYLTVNKSAHFFELIIDKVRSVEGTQINTAANCVAEYVEAYDSNGLLVNLDDPNLDESTISYYDIYWRTRDDDGKSIENKWITNDQALCESFNIAAGTSYDTSNKYYWRLVTATSNDSGANTVYMNFLTHEWDTTPHANNTSVIEIPDLFTFTTNVNGTDVEFTDFEIDSQRKEWDEQQQAWISEWDSQNNTWNAETTTYGLQIRPIYTENNETYRAIIKNGTFTFETTELSKLNIGIYYDDDTYEFFAADNDNPSDGFKTQYSITTSNTEAGIKMIIINTVVIDEWDECHWIRLSNTICDTGLSGKSAIPSIGDNIVQLGYRYNAYEPEDPEYDVSRASAIIIAAYASPDSGVVPPSYAQYQDITDFSLSTHRGTYMDATGAHIVGILEGGTTIAPGVTIPVNIEQYKLVGPVSIYEDANHNFDPATITFQILHSDSNGTSLLSTLPNGFSLKVNGTTQNSLVVTSASSLFIELVEGNKTWDAVDIKAQSVDVLDGQWADFTDVVYKAWTVETPSKPSDVDDYWDNFTNAQKNGWSREQPAPTQNYPYIWQTSRLVTYNSNNIPWYNNWSAPTRITGVNGDPGRDGNGEENIFKHYENALTVSDLSSQNNNPSLWGENLTEQEVNSFLNSYNWSQDPQGITSSYMYEYVSTRKYYLDTNQYSNTYNQMVWSYFSTPKLWAKWGENGQDGAGVKYIFRKYKPATASGILSNYTPTFSGNGYPNDAANRPDQYNNIWYDNSIEPDATGDVYCSQSTNYQVVEVNGTPTMFWTNFRQPEKWLTYVTDGSTGPQGPQGPDGESYQLLKLSEVFEVQIDRSTTSNPGSLDNVKGTVYTEFKYMVDKIVGDEHHIMTATELNNVNLKVTVDGKGVTSGDNTQTFTLSVQTESGTNNGYFYFQNNNILTYLNNHTGNYSDYYWLHKNGYIAYMPTKANIGLYLNSYTYYLEDVPLIFKPDHYFKFGEYAFNSLYQGLSGNQNGEYTTAGWSQIHQDWSDISLGVYNINNVNGGNGYPTSTSLEHYIYKTQSTKPTRPANTSNNGNWLAPTGWYKTPTAPTSSTKYCWICVSSKNISDGTWSIWSDPQIISSYESGSVVFPSSINGAQLDITANQIATTVYNNNANGYQTASEVTVTANSVASTVYNTNANGYQTRSDVEQTAESISFSVQSDIEGKLIKTGININNNVISLDSANTTIGGDVYIHNGNLISDGVDKETAGMVRTESAVSTTSGSKSTTPVEFKTFVAGDVFRVSDLFVEYYNTKTGVFSEEHITTGCTFYIKKGTGTAQSITTSTSITFNSSTAGTYSFYATYNNLPADCILYGFMDYYLTSDSITEIASNGINIADNNDYMRFDTSAQKFIVETKYQKGNADERGMSMKIDNSPIMTRLLNQEPGSIISGGSYPNDLNHPTYSTLAATSSGNIGWGTTNAQLSIARYNNTSTANTVYIHSDVDVYIFTSNTVNTTFYIGGAHNDTSKGLVNGRQIWIKGHPNLTVDPTNYDNYPNEAHTIMLKSQYWNNTSVGSKTMSSSNGYSWHLVYYYGTWIEI